MSEKQAEIGITLDIGGEGRHAGAINLNPSRHKTLGKERGQPIPRLIVGRADALPLADRSVARVIVERTPLRPAALREIARVLAPGGTVILRHVPLENADRHAAACRVLGGKTQQRRLLIANQWIQETTIELQNEACLQLNDISLRARRARPPKPYDHKPS